MLVLPRRRLDADPPQLVEAKAAASMSDTWRWEYGYEYSDDPIYRSSMDVLVPEPSYTIEPFGFSRALHEPSADDELSPIFAVFGATGVE